MYFLKTMQVQVRAPCHGGMLYSFFYIDGMLFEFMNVWNIEKCSFTYHAYWLNGIWFLLIVDREF